MLSRVLHFASESTTAARENALATELYYRKGR
jgi:hypothetical protein